MFKTDDNKTLWEKPIMVELTTVMTFNTCPNKYNGDPKLVPGNDGFTTVNSNGDTVDCGS